MAQAKRSPILGYNHNVKYRGVIFHVQTEDSGQQNPHLFTHLFHEGVIVSTRKYVYDASSNEDAIKGLMQAQHKAVMKDLRKGAFDDKIDAYLTGTPGLEPRAGAPADAAPLPRGERATTEADPSPPVTASGTNLEIINDELSEPIELPLKARTASSDQTRPMAAIDAAVLAPAPEAQEPPVKARTSTAQKVSRSSGAATPKPAAAQEPLGRAKGGGEPLLEITEDEIGNRLRGPRDTNVESVPDDVGDGVPRGAFDSVPPGATTPVRSNPAAHGAAALPSAKPPSRPGSVEIYQPAPASVEAQSGERSERAGTYSVSRKSGDAPIREKTGRMARIDPDRPTTTPPARPGGRPASEQTGGTRTVQAGATRDSGAQRVPQNVPREPTPSTHAPRPGTPPPPPAARSGTPQQVRPTVTAPIANRTSTPVNPQPGSGVVMTRPAVIVGAPPKVPAHPTTQRVRKAREDEGRGFGQGLISEKSLDEVILAYLSEDAEDK